MKVAEIVLLTRYKHLYSAQIYSTCSAFAKLNIIFRAVWWLIWRCRILRLLVLAEGAHAGMIHRKTYGSSICCSASGRALSYGQYNISNIAYAHSQSTLPLDDDWRHRNAHRMDKDSTEYARNCRCDGTQKQRPFVAQVDRRKSTWNLHTPAPNNRILQGTLSKRNNFSQQTVTLAKTWSILKGISLRFCTMA